MRRDIPTRWGRRAALACAAAALLPLAAFADTPAVAEPTPGTPTPVAAPGDLPTYTLDQCVAISLDRQPALAAARASLAQKQQAADALNGNRLAACLSSELRVRQAQAAQGVAAGVGDLTQTEAETKYAVTRTYFTAIYAKLQLDTADDVAVRLKDSRDHVAERVKNASKEYTQRTVEKLTVYVKLAESRRAEAAVGMERALSALREAMAVGGDCQPFQLADRSLPIRTLSVDKCQVIELALARRGEIHQAKAAAVATALEVDAQNRFRLRPTFRTFAATADLHARPIPPGLRNGDYRPGAVGPEMPANLAGNRDARVDQAQSLSRRANAVVQKTHELLQLEAEDAHLKWSEAVARVGHTRGAADAAANLTRLLREDELSVKVSKEDILNADLLAGQARSDFNKAAFDLVLAYANLERVTSGGFSAGLGQPQP